MTNPQDVTAWLDRIKFAHLNNETVIAESLALSAIEATNNAPAIREVAGMLAFDRGDSVVIIRLEDGSLYRLQKTKFGKLLLSK